MLKSILLILALAFLAGCSRTPRLAVPLQSGEKTFNYALYVPFQPLVHDPVSAIFGKKYYVKFILGSDKLDKLYGHEIFLNGEKEHKECEVTIGKRNVVLKNFYIYNSDGTIYKKSHALNGRYKIVSTPPTMPKKSAPLFDAVTPPPVIPPSKIRPPYIPPPVYRP